MHRLLGDNHVLEGLPFSAQEFLRALDGIRRRIASSSGVSGIELSALSRVAERSGLTTAALGKSLELTPEASDALIYGLITRGLVKPTGVDQPELAMELTVLGHELMVKAYQDFQLAVNDAASSLDEERRWGLESGMLKMARKLDNQDFVEPS